MNATDATNRTNGTALEVIVEDEVICTPTNNAWDTSDTPVPTNVFLTPTHFPSYLGPKDYR